MKWKNNMSNFYDWDRTIIDIATDFYDAYKRCIEPKNGHIDEYGRECYKVVNVPAIVNGAFACELYIKAHLPSDITGHKLKELFDYLPEKTRKEIEKGVFAKLKLDNNNFNFEDTLSKFSNAFPFWRYIHEKESLGELGLNRSLRFLEAFLEIIKDKLG